MITIVDWHVNDSCKRLPSGPAMSTRPPTTPRFLRGTATGKKKGSCILLKVYPGQMPIVFMCSQCDMAAWRLAMTTSLH